MPTAPRPRELLGTLAAVGVFDLLAACGPVAPAITSGDSSDTGDTGDTSGPPTTGASDPTAPDPSGPDPSGPDPTAPPPECNDSSDCSELYCGYCDQGTCREGGGCCGVAPARPDMQRFRCGPSYECYYDGDCADGYECALHTCVPRVTTALPACDAPDFILHQWNLGVSPGAFVLADFDLDGDLDLAAAQPSVAQVQIALNDGAGGFTLAGAFGVGDPLAALAIVAGDFDDDLEDDDLAVLRRDAAGGLILLFGQDAVFTPQPLLPTAPSPINLLGGTAGLVTISPGEVRVRPAPFFADEFPALAANLDQRASLGDITTGGANELVGTLTDAPTVVGAWLRGEQNDFIPEVFIDPHVEHALTLVGDLDQTAQPEADDHSSLILARTVDGHGEIEVWTGIDAPNRLAAPLHFTTSAPITGGFSFDLDAPQGLDVLVTTGQASVVRVLGDGVGGFMCEHLVPVPAPTTASLLVAGDLNDDAHVDLVVGDPNSGIVSVLMAP